MNVDFSQQAEISPDVLAQEVNGETVLLDLKSESYFGLDTTGTRIWQLIQQEGGLQAAFDTMLAEYDVDEKRLRDDFSGLLAKLTEAGLVSVKPGP